MTQLLPSLLVSLSAVFFVVDPIGAVPVFLSMTANDTPQKLESMARRACLAAGGLLLFFAFFGGLLFQVLGITLSAFKVAGGILLLITALDMLRARQSNTRTSPSETREGSQKEDIALVPLAIPILSGPGSIATVMVLMSRGQGVAYTSTVVLAVIVTFVAAYFVLRSSTLVLKVLKNSGVAILQRVMGLILAAISVQFMADGIRELFPKMIH